METPTSQKLRALKKRVIVIVIIIIIAITTIGRFQTSPSAHPVGRVLEIQVLVISQFLCRLLCARALAGAPV